MAVSPYEQLEQEFRRLHAFRGALSLLRWDAAVMMPRGSADVRGEAALLGQARGLAPYDALVDGFTPGISTADIDTIFKALSRKLPSLINEAIEVQAAHAPTPLTGKFTVARQRTLSVDVLKTLGFPFDRGRLDESEHPFTEGVPGDIRVTTRFDLSDPLSGLLGAVHETGHAMYDLGLPQPWRDQPVGRDRGLALEESQALLFEMHLCRSRAFVEYVRPLMEKYLQVSGPEWDEANLYRHLIRVRRSTIRMDADELTYPVHIMLRYELEKKILEGSLPVADLP